MLFFLSSCLIINNVKNDAYKGIITRTFNDVENHYVFSFTIRTNNETFVIISENFPRSWEFASVGDSIIKNKGETSIIIKKSNGEIGIFDFEN